MNQNIAKLTFKNCAPSNRTSDIVIFQNYDSDGLIIFAYHVIHNCQFTYTNTFNYYKEINLVIEDCDGNQTKLSNVKKGYLYGYSKEKGIFKKSKSYNLEIIEIQNKLYEGTISVAIQRNDELIYEKTQIHPDEIISFRISNEIYVGHTEYIVQGQRLCRELIDRFQTKLNLEGIKSADLVLKGGGFGPKAEKFYFVLENIEK